MSTNEGNNLHMDMDCTSTTDNVKLAATTLARSQAAYQHMNPNNFNPPGNACLKKMRKDFVGTGNIPMMGDTSMNSGCIMSGRQMSGVNLNMGVATIPQSMPTISSNSLENIFGQMSANGLEFLPAIQRPPANVSHVLKHQVDAACRLQLGGQMPPRPSQRYTNVSAGMPQQQQAQQASSDRDLNVHMIQVHNGCVRYHNDQDQMMQQRQQSINILCNPVGFQIKKSRCNMTAMQPSIEHISQPLRYLHQQQSTAHAMESNISHDNVQCDALDLRLPWSQIQTLRSMPMQHQLVQSAHTSSDSQSNPTPRTSTSILDLNDDCLIEIGQKLDQYDLYRLRESHNRFAFATGYCYNKMDSDNSLVFDFKCWSEDHGIGYLVKILDYFGDCMTRVRIDEFFTRYVREKCISQSFLAERLKNVRFLRLYYAEHNEIEFLTALKDIHEFELEGSYNYMPLHVRWSHLNQLNVIMDDSPGPRKIENGSDQIIAFLMRHKGIQKLSIRICPGIDDPEKLCEIIATHTSELIELDLGRILVSSITSHSMMNALRKLRIGVIGHLAYSFEKFENLKSLSLTWGIELREVCEIVRKIPSLTHLEIPMLSLMYLHLPDDVEVSELDCMIHESLIEKRKLNPNCESELLRIYIAFLIVSIGTFKKDYYPQPVERCEEYVKIFDWKAGRESYKKQWFYP